MTGISCDARATYHLEWNGTPDELVDLAEDWCMRTKLEQLDSHDLGDAMGFFIELTTLQSGELHIEDDKGHTLKMTMDFDLFEWQGLNTLKVVPE